MKILIACEYSGILRDAFLARGHDVMSCDTAPTERPGPHYRGDVRDILYDNWDMLMAFPPCTHIAISGARHFEEKRKDGRQQAAIDFFMMFVEVDIPKKCIENPVCIMSTLYRKPDQIIQPYQYGHPHSKRTCLWLYGLPKLKPTNILTKPSRGYWRNQTSSGQNIFRQDKARGKRRTRTYCGIAVAMAEQWG